jgi:hypothetical protein
MGRRGDVVAIQIGRLWRFASLRAQPLERNRKLEACAVSRPKKHPSVGSAELF